MVPDFSDLLSASSAVNPAKLFPMSRIPNILPDSAMDDMKLDRSVVRFTTFAQSDIDDRAFWHAQTVAVRLAQVERLRQMNYGYDPATARLQRVFGVIQRAPR